MQVKWESNNMQWYAMHVKAHMQENAMQCIGKCMYAMPCIGKYICRGMQCNAWENAHREICNVMHSKIYKGPDQNVSYTTPMRVYPPNIDACLHHHRAITDILKGRIVEARGLGLTHDEIGEELDIPRSTVASFLQRF